MTVVREIKPEEKEIFNQVVDHVIQSWEWGEFRKKNGLEVYRFGEFEGEKLISAFQFSLHGVPILNRQIAYLPKGPMPTKKMVEALSEFGKKKNIAYFKLEPNVIEDEKKSLGEKVLNLDDRFTISPKPLFTKFNFLVDLSKSEEGLLLGMHPKTRYNIQVAKKKGVEVYESVKDEDFETYLKLYFETTKRQKYLGHTHKYHRLVWQTLKNSKMARVIIGKYQHKPLVAWMLFNFGKTLYYPYGGSSLEYKEVMASNLVAWEAIRLGKKMGLATFDIWGALGPEATESNPWYGFHRFKAGYGGKLVEYVGTYDFVLNASLYNVLNAADKLRWMMLRVKQSVRL